MQVDSAPSIVALMDVPSVNPVPSNVKVVSSEVMEVMVGELVSSASYLQFEVTKFAQSYFVEATTS